MMRPAQQLTLPLGHTPCFGRDSFFVAPHNALAFEALCTGHSPPQSFLWGDGGCGKTHLAHIWAQDNGASFLAHDRLESINLLEEIRYLDAVVLEDLHALGPRDEALFHLINLSKELGKPLLLTSQLRAQDLTFTLPDLRSRLLALAAFHIEDADDGARALYLYKCFSDRQIKVPRTLVEDILARTSRSFHTLARVAAKLCEGSLRTKKAPSRQLLKEILEEEGPLAP